MKDIVNKIKKYIDKLEWETQCSEDYIDGEDIVYEMKCYIEELKEKQANKTFLDRLKEERDELKERLEKLEACLKNPPKKISTRQLGLLEEQEKAMSRYLYILNQRLEDFEE